MKLRNRLSYMSSDDDMVDITTTGTTQESGLPQDYQQQSPGKEKSLNEIISRFIIYIF